MAQEEKNCCGAENKGYVPKRMSAWPKYVLGLILLVAGGSLVLKYWDALVLIFKGSIGLFLLLAGSITLAIAKE